MYIQIVHHTTISVELGVSSKFEVLKLKTCSLYHENLLLQKFNDMKKYFARIKKGTLLIWAKCESERIKIRPILYLHMFFVLISRKSKQVLTKFKHHLSNKWWWVLFSHTPIRERLSLGRPEYFYLPCGDQK